MASRREQKEQLRQERLARERAERETGRRRRRLYGFGIGGILLIAAALAITIAVTAGGNGADVASGSPFGQHYNSLEQRRAAANVTTMMDTMGSTAHFHPQLRIYVNGKQTKVPANIGIDPDKPSMDMASLHTHNTSGTIHVEGMEPAKLGQFFMVWGVPFSKDRLGPYRVTKRKPVKMWVDDKPSRAFGNLALHDKQQIVISYGTKAQDPIK